MGRKKIYSSESEKNAAKYRRAKARNPDYNRERSLKHRYGLTKDDWDAMLEKQGGGCAICGTADNLVVDHSHETGENRGVLCNNCNSGIGMLNDDAELVANALKYLVDEANMVAAQDCDS